MPPRDRRTRWLRLLLLTGLAATGSAGVARAQNEDIVDDAVAVPQVMIKAAPAAIPNLEQVDQWVFARMGGSAAARSRLESALEIHIDDIERACAVSEAQKKKLKLAGLGDIKRFYDRVEDVKRKMLRTSNQPNNNIWQEVQPLQVEIQTGLFGDESIFKKTLKKTLSDEQASRYDAVLSERILERRRATIEIFVAHLDKAVGLGDDQRTRLTELLLDTVPPPQKMGQSDYWYYMFRTSKLPESTLRPIFDAPQWRILSRQFPQARGMEQWLKNAGVIATENGANAPPQGGASKTVIRPLNVRRGGIIIIED